MNDGKELEIELGVVKKRSLLGILTLTSRSFLVQAISFGSTLLLTVFLEPKIFGIFFLVSAFINFFSYFSDIGLAAALIQKKDKIKEEDLKTTFLIQETLVLFLVFIIFALSPLIRQWYGLSQSAVYLFYALGISFFLSSLKTIPSVLLERDLKFNLLIIPQILETIVFSLVSVILAWLGFGVASFTWAVLARGVVGLAAIYLISPWKIGLAFSRESLSQLLKFGLPYQANTLIAVLKDDLMTVFLGKVIGTTGLGYLGWAKKWAEQPLRFFMDNVLKVTFPAFSRMQGDKNVLKKSVEKSIFFLSFLIFPFLVGFSVLASDLVKIIPKYLKWQPALFALYLYCFNSAWATVSTTMTNLLNSLGKIKVTFKLMVMWLVLTWSLMPVAAVKLGYNGVALSAAIISISSIFAILSAKKYVNFELSSSVGKPLLAALFMGLIIYLFNPPFGLIISFLLRITVGIFVYLGTSWLLLGRPLIDDVAKIYHEFKKNH